MTHSDGGERPLVLGDAEETEVRQAFAQATAHALEVAQKLASTAGRADRTHVTEPRIPRRSAGRPSTTVEQALHEGWLVSAADPDANPRPGPLSGLRVAVKDNIDVAGMPVRNGTPRGLWRQPAESAPAWQSLANAGARCIGKAATHEMAWGVTTPQIAHPTFRDRIVGGSSGGPAACVAAGVCEGALGTDTGGSIRIPAALCGIVGFRPTHGTIDMSGITPLAPTQDVAGPLATDVATCTAMLEVLIGRDLAGHLSGGVGGLRIGLLSSPGPLDEPTDTAYRMALSVLERLGVELVSCDTQLPRSAASVSLLTMLRESAQLHAPAVRADPAGFGSEARALLTLGERLDRTGPLIAAARRSLVARTAELFAEHRLDAFLTPTTASVAPNRECRNVRIGDRDVPVSAALTRFTAWSPVVGTPAVTVPAPSDRARVGLQIMAPPHQEHTCVRVAAAIEGAGRP